MQQATTIRRDPPFVGRRQNILVVKTLVCSLVELSRRVASCKLILTVCLSQVRF